MTKINKAITAFLVQEWNRQGISLELMSERTGLTKDALRKIRNGDRNAGLDTACAIAKVLEVRIGEIIDRLN